MKKYLALLFLLCSGIANAQYTKLYDFSNATGVQIRGYLVFDGTYLFGNTEWGGANAKGVLFRIKPDGTGYTILHDFAGGLDGENPRGSLFYDGTFLYGETQTGGIADLGTIFKIKPDGTGYLKIFDFTGPATGDTPMGALISDGTFLYGTTTDAGSSNNGTVFKIMPDGTGYVKLKNFSGTDGLHPYASLLFDGTFLYGTTLEGGTSNLGTIYKIKPDGTGFITLLNFNGAVNGSYPQDGALYSDGTYLYGTAHYGGTSGTRGTLYKILPNGTGFVKLLDFNGANGSYAMGTIVSDGTFLYATTYLGGLNNAGVFFKIKPNGTSYSKLLDFDNANNGLGPFSSLSRVGTTIFGTTSVGGINSKGTLFRYCFPTTGDTTAVACGSFNWHGTIYSSTSTPTHTYASRLGCDSVVTLHLTIRNNSAGDTIATTCSSFNWHNTLYTNSSTATHAYVNSIGCDSIVTLHLTINRVLGDTSATTCENFNWHNTTYTSTTTATHTYSTVAGCDSVVTLHLTINRDAGDTVVAACENFSWHDTTYITTTTATHTYRTNAGCDSVVTLHLTINHNGTGDTIAAACENFDWHDTTYTSTGTAMHTYLSSAGCDSVVTLHLTINHSSAGDTTAVVCEKFTWHNTTYVSSGLATHNYTNGFGCDSVVTLHLTINNENTGDTTAVACENFTWQGTTYTTSSLPSHIFTNVAGCDSVVTLHLTINTVDTSTSVTGNVITASAASATYQWIDCDNNNQPLSGEINQSLTPAASGNYAVIVTQNGCSDTSSCVAVTSVGIQNFLSGSSSVSIYPNPTNNEFTIDITSVREPINIEMYDVAGRLILQNNCSVTKGTGQIKIPVQNIDNGIYFLKINTEGKTIYYGKVIKQ